MSFPREFKHYVLPPGIKVFAGPFKSTVWDMVRAGWSFECELDVSNDRTLILGKSPVGLIFINRIETIQFRYTNDFEYMYVPEDAILQANISREMHMPVLDLVTMDIGESINPNSELRIYNPLIERNNIDNIIIKPENVPELLKKINEAQEPRAREILLNQQKRNEFIDLSVKAKILTFNRN